MPQRPPDGSSAGSGDWAGDRQGQDYGWLYGGRQPGQQPRQQPRQQAGRQHRPEDPSDSADSSEATQVLPRHTERSGSRPGSPPAARRDVRPAQPVLPPRSPGGRGRSKAGSGKGGPGRGRTIRRVLLLVLVLWLAFLIAVPLWAFSHITKVDAFPSTGRPADQPGTTYLLVGSDSRKGLSQRQNRRLGTGGVGDVGQRTDTIMLLHTGSGPDVLLSIPRDSIVPIPGHGTTKINSAFAYGGPKLLVQTIEQNTGVRIDDYVEIGFGGFVNSVDAVGGVDICPTKRMVDPRANLRIRKGCQKVNGVTALGYARSRHTSGLGDIDRAKHQREVVSAIGAKVKSPWTVLNPFRYWGINDAATSSLKVSKGMSPFALAGFGWAMMHVNGTNGLTCSMPIRDLAVHWDRTKALALLKLIKEDRTQDITKGLCQSTGMAP